MITFLTTGTKLTPLDTIRGKNDRLLLVKKLTKKIIHGGVYIKIILKVTMLVTYLKSINHSYLYSFWGKKKEILAKNIFHKYELL